MLFDNKFNKKSLELKTKTDRDMDICENWNWRQNVLTRI